MPELVRISGCDNPQRRGDVVFVHGLNGDPRDYWGPPGSHWPAWLGEDLPDVGVWSLGYENAAFKPRRLSILRFFFERGFAMPLESRARNVLLRFEVEAGIGQKPLVFITHSMGGLLVKQLLRTANESPPGSLCKPLLENTRGVCFIATPHIGSDLAKWVSYFGRLLGTTVAVAELRPHLPYLIGLNGWYRDFVHHRSIKTLTFYETKPLRPGGLVVDPGDADPGVPLSLPYPLDDDHRTICKPGSKRAEIHLKTIGFVNDCLQSPAPQPHSVDLSSVENQVLIKDRESLHPGTTRVASSTDFAASDSSAPGSASRVSLVFALSRLAPPDFATLVTAIPGAATQISRHGTIPEQAAELVRWAESSTGRGLASVEGALGKLQNP